ncbi:hypothetical protein LTR62_002955 [Meristemomyces frigidus]|uniref:Uncharacterized protein n=1 Tax=Meristemomyces frigidus TaxID=1508187 RepID=A0AAN7YKV0_9PEZI|nr:hypothetical protein LTR62_002955 [Meristemomyces frigidus]
MGVDCSRPCQAGTITEYYLPSNYNSIPWREDPKDWTGREFDRLGEVLTEYLGRRGSGGGRMMPPFPMPMEWVQGYGPGGGGSTPYMMPPSSYPQQNPWQCGGGGGADSGSSSGRRHRQYATQFDFDKMQDEFTAKLLSMQQEYQRERQERDAFLFGSEAERRQEQYKQRMLKMFQEMMPQLYGMTQMSGKGAGAGMGGMSGMGMGGGMNPMMGGQAGGMMGGMEGGMPGFGGGMSGGMGGGINPMAAAGASPMMGMSNADAAGLMANMGRGNNGWGSGAGGRRRRRGRSLVESDDEDDDFGGGGGGFGRRRRRGRRGGGGRGGMFDDDDDDHMPGFSGHARSGPRGPRPRPGRDDGGGATFGPLSPRDQPSFMTSPPRSGAPTSSGAPYFNSRPETAPLRPIPITNLPPRRSSAAMAGSGLSSPFMSGALPRPTRLAGHRGDITPPIPSPQGSSFGSPPSGRPQNPLGPRPSVHFERGEKGSSWEAKLAKTQKTGPDIGDGPGGMPKTRDVGRGAT